MSRATGADAARREEDRIRQAYARRGTVSRDTFFNPGHLFILQERQREMLRALRRSGRQTLRGDKILEVGCGTGFWLREFVDWAAAPTDVVGVELLADRAVEAKRACAVGTTVIRGSGADLPFRDGSFDIVLQSTVFTSIIDGAVKQRIAAEMLRVLKPEGIVLWYDFFVNNPANRDVRGVGKGEITSLFPGCEFRLRRVTLAPPVARFVARWSWTTCHILSAVPLLRTYYIGLILKRRTAKGSRARA